MTAEDPNRRSRTPRSSSRGRSAIGSRAGIASILAAVGLLGFYVLQQVLQRDMPKVSGLETLVRAAQPGDVGALPSLQTAFFEYLDTKTVLVLLIGLGGFIGWIGVAWAVGFLGVATRARKPDVPQASSSTCRSSAASCSASAS